MRKLLGIAILTGLLCQVTAWAAPVLPAAPNGYILDEAGILSEATESQLSSTLTLLDQETSTQMVVVTVTDLQGYAIEEFALELGRAWGVGQDEFDNGLVLLISPNDRLARIEVGYGLEGAITDAASSLIMQNEILPHFKANDYDSGVLAGIAALETLARGESYATTQNIDDNENALYYLIYALPFLWALLSWMSHSKAWWLGGIFGGVGAFLLGGTLLALGIGALVGLFLDFILSKFFYKKINSHWFIGGGGPGGGSRGGGFGGFGGGSFGGGGSSGSW